MRSGAAGLTIAFLLAGCVGPSGTLTPRIDDPDFDDATGAIRGIVVDDQLQPLAAVTIRLDELETTESNNGGSFEFRRVDPGDHVLVAFKGGFEAAEQRADVLAGDVTRVQLLLRPLPNAADYHETRIQTGVSDCSVAWRAATQNGASNVCGPLVYAGVGQSATFFTFQPLDDIAGWWFETVWLSAQALGPGMRVEWYYPADSQNLLLYPLVIRQGTSPVQAPLPFDELANRTSGSPSPECTPQRCVIVGIHYAYAQALGPSSPADLGLVLQQRFDDHVTVFYGATFPERFTALSDQ